MTAMTALEAGTTLGAKQGASRTSYQPDVQAIDDPNVILFDFMDPAYIRAVHGLPALTGVKWVKGMSLPAVALDFCGTTTHWQTILLYNGYIASSKIPAGATLNIPDVSRLKTKLQATKKGTVTRV